MAVAVAAVVAVVVVVAVVAAAQVAIFRQVDCLVIQKIDAG